MVLPLQARVDLRIMAMKGYSAFPKVYWNFTIKLFSVHIQDTRWGGAYVSAEKQSVYSTAPANWTGRQLYGIKYSYVLQLIFKQIYF